MLPSSPSPPTAPEQVTGRSVADDLSAALAAADAEALARLADRVPRDRHDAAQALAQIHDLHVGPVMALGDAVRFQHHPATAALKDRIESQFLRRLRQAEAELSWPRAADPVAAVRAIGGRDQVPALYRWLAEHADRRAMLDYLALEGGPDGGFDDLVALCQVGLDGLPKLEMAANYWDEMGRGEAGEVHTELYRRFVGAVDLPVVPRPEQPVEALERALLGTMLATNRVLQPEMVGALGLIELQAGPRCRQVLAGFDRVGVPDGARPFYEEHAVTDPRHGKAWLDRVIAPLGRQPGWAEGIVRGARWRWIVNDRFFAAMAERFATAGEHALAS